MTKAKKVTELTQKEPGRATDGRKWSWTTTFRGNPDPFRRVKAKKL